jgi:hypothetical protein
MSWLIRLVFAGIILLLVYAAIKVVNPGLFPVSSEIEHLDRYGRPRVEIIPQKILTAENKKLKHDLSASQQSNNKLKETIKNLEIEANSVNKQLIDLVEKDEPTYPEKTLLIENVINQLNSPSIISYSFNGKTQDECGKPTNKLVDAWLQFLLLYSRLQLSSLDTNDFDFDLLILEHANLLNEISLQSLSTMEPLVRNLLAYHETVVGLDGWEEILNQSTEVFTHSNTKASLIDELYKRGYPATNDACLFNALEISADGYGGSKVSIEEWLYTFWVRRHNEGTFESAFLVLKLVELILDNKDVGAINTYVFERRKIDRSGDIENNAQILDIYNNLFVSRIVNEEVVIFVNDIEKKPDVSVIYPFKNGNKFNSLQYLNTKSIMVGDESSPSFAHIYGSNDSSVKEKRRGRFSFYSKELVVNSTSVYAEVKASDYEIKEVEKLIESDFGSPWAIDNTASGIKYCSKQSGMIKRFISTTNEIYIARKSCTRWSGDGTVGPYVLIIATRNDHGALFIKHQFIGDAGRVGSLRLE